MTAELRPADACAARAVLADLDAIVGLLGADPSPMAGTSAPGTPSAEEGPTGDTVHPLADRTPPHVGAADRDDDASLLAAILAAARTVARDTDGAVGDDVDDGPGRGDVADPDADPAADDHADDAADDDPGRGERRVRRRSRWWYAAAAAAVVALGVGGTLALGTTAPPAVAGAPVMLQYSDGTPEDALTQHLPSARDTLLGAAAAADATPDPEPGGPVQLVQSTNWWGWAWDDGVDRVEKTVPVVRSSWLAPDGSMVAEEAHYGSFAPSGSLVQPAIPPGVTNARDTFPAGTADAGLASSIAADPSDVAHRLVVGLFRDGPCDPAQYECFVSAVQNLYMQQVVPSAARATLWRELASRPDARLLGRVSDRLGRHGVAVADVQHGDAGRSWVRVLVIDPTTGDLLGVERISVLPGQEPVVQEVTVLTRHATVAAVGARP